MKNRSVVNAASFLTLGFACAILLGAAFRGDPARAVAGASTSPNAGVGIAVFANPNYGEGDQRPHYLIRTWPDGTVEIAPFTTLEGAELQWAALSADRAP